MLKSYPPLHAAAKSFYTQKLLNADARVTTHGFGLLGPDSMVEGYFEPEETAQLIALFAKVDRFVNIGANVGYYVCLARKHGLPTVAIEPLERNAQLLKRNLYLNDWMDTEFIPVALGQDKDVGLTRIFGGGTAASLVLGWAGGTEETFELVAVSTLDNVLCNRFPNERLLFLIDVEGFELNVLRGSVEQLQRAPAPIWYVEICITEHQPAGISVNPSLMETFEIFWSNGYSAEKAGSEKGAVSREDVERWSLGQQLPQSHNFLFRKSHVANEKA